MTPVMLPDRDLDGDPEGASFELDRDRACRTGDEVLEAAALEFTVAVPVRLIPAPSSRSDVEVDVCR